MSFNEYNYFDVIKTIISSTKYSNSQINLEYKNECTLVYCDINEIKDLLMRILSNAIKFSDKFEPINIVVTEMDDLIRTDIINKGVGVPPKELDLIFEKFTQSSRTNVGAGGAGLGLAICKEIVHSHKGDIWATSEEDGLTTFSFTLCDRSSFKDKIICMSNQKKQLDLMLKSISTGDFNVIGLSCEKALTEYLKKNRVDMLVIDGSCIDNCGVGLFKLATEVQPNIYCFMIGDAEKLEKVDFSLYDVEINQILTNPLISDEFLYRLTEAMSSKRSRVGGCH